MTKNDSPGGSINDLVIAMERIKKDSRVDDELARNSVLLSGLTERELSSVNTAEVIQRAKRRINLRIVEKLLDVAEQKK